MHYGRVFKCEVANCEAAFTERSKLRRHMVVHTGERRYVTVAPVYPVFRIQPFKKYRSGFGSYILRKILQGRLHRVLQAVTHLCYVCSNFAKAFTETRTRIKGRKYNIFCLSSFRFECEHCHAMFSLAHNLKTHVKMHLRDKVLVRVYRFKFLFHCGRNEQKGRSRLRCCHSLTK